MSSHPGLFIGGDDAQPLSSLCVEAEKTNKNGCIESEIKAAEQGNRCNLLNVAHISGNLHSGTDSAALSGHLNLVVLKDVSWQHFVTNSLAAVHRDLGCRKTEKRGDEWEEINKE